MTLTSAGDERKAIFLESGEPAGPPPYAAWEKARETLSPHELVSLVEDSGLRGRGGAGFPTGRKLRLTLEAPGSPKYVVVNGAEDEPGSLKDRHVLERAADKVVEGAMLAAATVGAGAILFYVSEQLAAAREAVARALEAAGGHGLDVLSSIAPTQPLPEGPSATVVPAPPAYVAGEDTAALEVIEGNEGLPREKPPYPAASGLWRKPTFVANVETFAAIPSIVWHGAGWYRSLGTADSPGTMLFTLGEEMEKPGVYELELGVPLRHLVDEVGAGLRSGLPVRAVLPGGPSSGFLPGDQLDVPLDHASLRAAGSALGCGVVRVFGATTCLVEPLEEILRFFAAECCGQCPPCRMETGMLLKIVEQVRAGKATDALLGKLPEVLEFAAAKGGLCSFIGMPGPPVRSALEHFHADFEHHLTTGRCPELAA